MNSIALKLLTVLACVWMTSSSGYHWWSLAVTKCSLTSNKDCENCTFLYQKGFINEEQRKCCEEDPRILEAIAVGARRAALSCQKHFVNNTWNCSTFDGIELYGKSIYQGSTREVAVLQSYNAAGATKILAEFCQEQRLINCPCVYSDKLHKVDKDTEYDIFRDCDDNVVWAAERVKEFQAKANKGRSKLDIKISEQNTRIGIDIVSDTTEVCTCYGVSGSCTLQSCYKRAPEVNTATEVLLEKYINDALQVNLNGDELVDGNDRTLDDNNTCLVYSEDSPSYCERDLEQGIIGTANRQCYDNCPSICCSRGNYQKTITKNVEECKFEFIDGKPDIVCTVTAQEEITEKRCNS